MTVWQISWWNWNTYEGGWKRKEGEAESLVWIVPSPRILDSGGPCQRYSPIIFTLWSRKQRHARMKVTDQSGGGWVRKDPFSCSFKRRWRLIPGPAITPELLSQMGQFNAPFHFFLVNKLPRETRGFSTSRDGGFRFDMFVIDHQFCLRWNFHFSEILDLALAVTQSGRPSFTENRRGVEKSKCYWNKWLFSLCRIEKIKTIKWRQRLITQRHLYE